MGRQSKSINKTGQTIAYKYDDSGVRTEKTVNGVTTSYHLIGDKVTYEDNGTDNVYYTYDSAGKLVSMNISTKISETSWSTPTEYFYVRNAQGDIIGLIDKSGTQVVTYTYDSWGKPFPEVKDANGNVLPTSGITGSLASTVGVKNPYRYRGYRYDTETGLYYLQSRYYNPEWGRFINADIFAGQPGEILSHNMFIYSMNDPINMADPSGFRPIYTLGEETDSMRDASLQVMNAVSKKEPPPADVGYVPPKGKGRNERVKLPNGDKGWEDADGDVWVPVPSGHPLAHGGEHWDVNYKNGGYDNVYPPDGHVRRGSGPRGKFSPEGKRIVMESAQVGGAALMLYGTYRVVRMVPSLAPPLWWTIPANIACP